MTSVSTRSAGRARSAASAAWPSATASTSQRGAQQPGDVLAHVRVVVGDQDPERAVGARAPSRSGRRRRRRRDRGRPGAAASRSASSTKDAPAAGRGRRRATPAAIRSAGRCACPRGSVTVKALPAPGWLSTAHRRRRAGARAPGRARGRCRCPRACGPRALSTRWKRSKIAVDLARRDADAGVADHQVDRRRRRSAQLDGDRALEGELEGVRQQVEDDLLPHVAVDVDGLAGRRAAHVERQPAPARWPSGRRWPGPP